jgi:hypothetical protein
MDVTKSSCSQVIPAARQVEKIPVVMRLALLPPPVSPFTVSCRSAFEPYTICAAGFTLLTDGQSGWRRCEQQSHRFLASATESPENLQASNPCCGLNICRPVTSCQLAQTGFQLVLPAVWSEVVLATLGSKTPHFTGKPRIFLEIGVLKSGL